MRRRSRSAQAPKVESPSARRDRFATMMALITIVCLGSAFVLSDGMRFLMPGPLASAHGAIENCGGCHTASGGGGNLSWLHGLFAGDPIADSKACLGCHKMSSTALNPHGASTEALNQSTRRLTKVAAATPAPLSAQVQNVAFPTGQVVSRGLYCATCHQEHKGVNFNLAKISNEQCRSCHVVKFDSFDGDHPKFDNYPFKRRTPVIYDHAAHFGKHFPEAGKQDEAKRVPATCSTCHNSRDDKRVMAVAPFDQTCNACHIDQITGKERASGPKGIAFLTLPGLDLQTLREKNASVGEWPEGSEAGLTPFMKVMISRSERGRALIKTVDGLNLQDLSGANDEQIRAVAGLAWEIKGLFYALISGRASDVLADLNLGSKAKLSPGLVADLTASLPRDVVISAHQQWLPNLATEMANRPDLSAGQEQSGGWASTITESRLSGSVSAGDLAGIAAPPFRIAQANQQSQSKNTPSSIAKGVRAEAYGQPSAGASGGGAVTRTAAADPQTVTPGSEPAAAPQAGGGQVFAQAQPQVLAQADTGGDDLLNATEEELRATGAPPAASAGNGGAASAPAEAPAPRAAAPSARPAPAAPKPAVAQEAVAAAPQAPGAGGADGDDLLNVTEEELRATGAPPAASAPATANVQPDAGVAPGGDAGTPAPQADAPAPETAAVDPQPRAAAPAITIQSDVDPESWAEYGGWYGQDYAISYRPTGHKDKFIYSWLFLTGPQAPKGNRNPAAAVFDSLIAKDAQGSCTKCHSVDDVAGKGRLVNFSPPKAASKQGRFTRFVHEPHFGVLEDRGCLTCHNLEKGRPYLKSYEQGNPRSFASGFSGVKKDLCQTCHTANMARQDCLLCHKYHVDDVITPIMNTKIPVQ